MQIFKMPAVNTAENANKKPDAQHRSRKTGVDRKQYRNAMKKLTAKEALPYFLYNLPQYSKHAERMNTLLSLLDILLKTTPVYLLSCTPDKSAAILAEQTLFGSTT